MSTTNIYKNLWFAVLLIGLLCSAPSSVSPPYISLPLSVANGGTSGTTAATARAGISAARSDANQTITGDLTLATSTAAAGLIISNGGSAGFELISAGQVTGQYFADVSGNTFIYTGVGAGVLAMTHSSAGSVLGGPLRLKGYTVATLPASPTQGDTAFVTDALAPTFLATIVGGGTVKTPVFYNGSNWVGY